MTVHWYRVKKTYAKPQGGFLAIGPRYPGVLSNARPGGALHASGRRTMDRSGSRRASRGGFGGAEAASSWEVVRRDAASWRSSQRPL